MNDNNNGFNLAAKKDDYNSGEMTPDMNNPTPADQPNSGIVDVDSLMVDPRENRSLPPKAIEDRVLAKTQEAEDRALMKMVIEEDREKYDPNKNYLNALIRSLNPAMGRTSDDYLRTDGSFVSPDDNFQGKINRLNQSIDDGFNAQAERQGLIDSQQQIEDSNTVWRNLKSGFGTMAANTAGTIMDVGDKMLDVNDAALGLFGLKTNDSIRNALSLQQDQFGNSVSANNLYDMANYADEAAGIRPGKTRAQALIDSKVSRGEYFSAYANAAMNPKYLATNIAKSIPEMAATMAIGVPANIARKALEFGGRGRYEASEKNRATTTSEDITNALAGGAYGAIESLVDKGLYGTGKLGRAATGVTGKASSAVGKATGAIAGGVGSIAGRTASAVTGKAGSIAGEFGAKAGIIAGAEGFEEGFQGVTENFIKEDKSKKNSLKALKDSLFDSRGRVRDDVMSQVVAGAAMGPAMKGGSSAVEAVVGAGGSARSAALDEKIKQLKERQLNGGNIESKDVNTILKDTISDPSDKNIAKVAEHWEQILNDPSVSNELYDELIANKDIVDKVGKIVGKDSTPDEDTTEKPEANEENTTEKEVSEKKPKATPEENTEKLKKLSNENVTDDEIRDFHENVMPIITTEAESLTAEGYSLLDNESVQSRYQKWLEESENKKTAEDIGSEKDIGLDGEINDGGKQGSSKNKVPDINNLERQSGGSLEGVARATTQGDIKAEAELAKSEPGGDKHINKLSKLIGLLEAKKQKLTMKKGDSTGIAYSYTYNGKTYSSKSNTVLNASLNNKLRDAIKKEISDIEEVLISRGVDIVKSENTEYSGKKQGGNHSGYSLGGSKPLVGSGATVGQQNRIELGEGIDKLAYANNVAKEAFGIDFTGPKLPVSSSKYKGNKKTSKKRKPWSAWISGKGKNKGKKKTFNDLFKELVNSGSMNQYDLNALKNELRARVANRGGAIALVEEYNKYLESSDSTTKKEANDLNLVNRIDLGNETNNATYDKAYESRMNSDNMITAEESTVELRDSLAEEIKAIEAELKDKPSESKIKEYAILIRKHNFVARNIKKGESIRESSKKKVDKKNLLVDLRLKFLGSMIYTPVFALAEKMPSYYEELNAAAEEIDAMMIHSEEELAKLLDNHRDSLIARIALVEQFANKKIYNKTKNDYRSDYKLTSTVLDRFSKLKDVNGNTLTNLLGMFNGKFNKGKKSWSKRTKIGKYFMDPSFFDVFKKEKSKEWKAIQENVDSEVKLFTEMKDRSGKELTKYARLQRVEDIAKYKNMNQLELESELAGILANNSESATYLDMMPNALYLAGEVNKKRNENWKPKKKSDLVVMEKKNIPWLRDLSLFASEVHEFLNNTLTSLDADQAMAIVEKNDYTLDSLNNQIDLKLKMINLLTRNSKHEIGYDNTYKEDGRPVPESEEFDSKTMSGFKYIEVNNKKYYYRFKDDMDKAKIELESEFNKWKQQRKEINELYDLRSYLLKSTLSSEERVQLYADTIESNLVEDREVDGSLDTTKDGITSTINHFIGRNIDKAKTKLRELFKQVELRDLDVNNTISAGEYTAFRHGTSHNTLRKVFSMFKNRVVIDKKKIKLNANDEYYKMFIGRDGKIDPMVHDIVVSRVIEYLSINSGALFQHNKQTLEEVLGEGMTDEMLLRYSKIGIPLSAVVDAIGKEVFNTMEFTVKNDADGTIKSGMIAALGGLAVSTMLNNNIIKTENISLETLNKDIRNFSAEPGAIDSFNEVVYVKFTNQDKKAKLQIDARKELFKRATESVGEIFKESTEQRIHTKPVTDVDTTQQGNNVELSPAQMKHLKKEQGKKHIINEGFFGTLVALGSVAKYIYGYRDISKMDPNNKIDIMAQEGKNSEIDQSFDRLIAHREKLNKAGETLIYFKHVVWSNTRFGMKSKYLNPLTDKMHRELVSNIAEGNDKPGAMVSPSTIGSFKAALVQRLMGDDPISSQFVEARFDELMSNTKFKDIARLLYSVSIGSHGPLTTAEKSNIKDAVEEAGEEMQSLAGFIAFGQFLDKSKADGSFTRFMSTITLEADQTNSGIALGAMNVLSEKMLGWMERAGIYSIDRMRARVKEINATRDAKDQIHFPEDNKDVTNAFLKTFDYNLVKQEMDDAYQHSVRWLHENHPSLIKAMEDAVGKKIIDDGKVTSFGRKMMKYPLMIFIYGAGNAAITDLIMNYLRTKALSDSKSTAKKEGIQDLRDNKLRKEEPGTTKKVNLESIRKEISKAVGAFFSTEFKEIQDTSNKMSMISNLQFEAWKNTLNSELIRINDSKNKTSQDRVKRRFTKKYNKSIKESDSAYAEHIMSKMSKDSLNELFASSKLTKIMPKVKLIFEEDKSMIAGMKIKQNGNDYNNHQVLVKPDGTQQKVGMKTTTFKNPKAALVVKAIHMKDANVVVRTNHSGLNVHDAIVSYVKNIAKEASTMNEKYIDAGLENTYENFLEVLREDGGFFDYIRELKNQGKLHDFYSSFIKANSKLYGNSIDAKSGSSDFNKEAAAFVNKEINDFINQVKEYMDNQDKFKENSILVANVAAGIPMVRMDLDSSKKKKTNVEGSSSSDVNGEILNSTTVKGSDVGSTYSALGGSDSRVAELLGRLVDKTKEFTVNFRAGLDNRGTIDLENNEIDISIAPDNKLRIQKADEIFAHEMLHPFMSLLRLKENYKHKILLHSIFMQAKDVVKWKDFLPAEVNYSHTERDIRDAKELYEYVFGGSKSDQFIEEFAVNALANKQLSDVLDSHKYKYKRRVSQGDTFFTKMYDWFINFFESLFSSKTLNQKMMNALDEMAGKQTKFQLFASKTGRIINSAVALEDKYMNKLNRKIERELATGLEETFDDYGKLTQIANLPDRFSKKNGIIGNIMTLGTTGRESIMKGFDNYMSKKDADSFVFSMYNHVKSKDDITKYLVMLRKSFKFIDTARREKHNIVKKIVSKYTDGLDDNQKISMNTMIVKTDLRSLFKERDDNFDSTIDKINSIFKNTDKFIATIENNLYSAGVGDIAIDQVKNLSYFMINGIAKTGLAMNATQIAMQMTNYYPKEIANIDRHLLISELDKLITLYAIKNTPKAAKELTLDMLKTKPSAVLGMVRLHAQMVNRSREELFDGSKALMIKGFSPTVLNNDLDTRFAPATEKKKLESQGWKMTTLVNGKMMLYVSRSKMLNNINKGTISYTSSKALGQSMFDQLLVEYDNSHVKAKKELNDRIAKYEKKMDADLKKDYSKRSQSKLIPLYNKSGKIVDFRFVMNEYEKTKFLGKDNRIDETISKGFQSIVDKVNSKAINIESVNMLMADYAKVPDDEKYKWEIVSPEHNSKYWYMLPSYVRMHIRNINEEGELYVPKRVKNIVLGTFTRSFREVVGSTPVVGPTIDQLMKYKQVAYYTDSIEAYLRSAISIIKTNDIIKTVSVWVNNLRSNLNVLWLHGISYPESISSMWEANKNLDHYLYYKYMHEYGVANNNDRVKKEAKYMMESNPIKPMMDAGFYGEMTEDIDMKDMDESLVSKSIRRKFEAGFKAVPGSKTLGTIANLLYMGKDTDLFKVQEKIMMRGDFLAKVVLYEKKIEDLKKEKLIAEKVKMNFDFEFRRAKIIEEVLGEFVNYNIPLSGFSNFLEKNGIFNYQKFFLGIASALGNNLKHNGGRVLVSQGLQAIVGDSPDIFDTYDHLPTNRNIIGDGMLEKMMLPGQYR